MTAITKRMTLAEYLSQDEATDRCYELVDGELVEMPPESPKNVQIALFLLVQFLKFVPIYRLSNKIEIAVSGRSTVRIPDLTVLTDELAAALQTATRSTMTPDLPPPDLVVEVVSPGKANENRDYRYKRSEYATIGILEYWVVDPQQQKVTVFTLVEGFYEEAVFRGSELIRSQIFAAFDLTAAAVLEAKA
jgi:Uma2 family endonuclease